MAGRPRRRAKRAAAAEAAVRLREQEAIARDGHSGGGVYSDDYESAEPEAAGIADAWREQLTMVEGAIRERARLLSGATTHPNGEYASQALQFGAMGIPQDVAATLLGLSEGELRSYYGQEYERGAAQMVCQVAGNLLRIATGTNDRYAMKAAVEVMHRRGGEHWRPPAQKVEVEQVQSRGLIDSSKLSYEDRQALKAIITRAVEARQNAGLLTEEGGDAE